MVYQRVGRVGRLRGHGDPPERGILGSKGLNAPLRTDTREAGFRFLRRRGGAGGSPAIQVCLSRFRGTVQQDPVQWQKWQIVQSQLDLRDLLP